MLKYNDNVDVLMKRIRAGAPNEVIRPARPSHPGQKNTIADVVDMSGFTASYHANTDFFLRRSCTVLYSDYWANVQAITSGC
jgi:hypothetical protein